MYHPWIKNQSHKNKGIDHLIKKLLIVEQIHLDSNLGNVVGFFTLIFHAAVVLG